MNRLMFIHHSGLIGGAGVSLVNNITKLSKDYEVKAYIPSDPNTISEMIKQQAPEVDVVEYGRRIGAITVYSGGDALFSRRFLYRLLLIFRQFCYWNSEIERQDPEVILINSKILCWMSLLPALRKRRSVLFVRETTQGAPDRIINRIIRSLLERFTVVSFLSEYDCNQENLKKARTTVICNSINSHQLHSDISDKNALEMLQLPQDEFYALYVGGVSEMKGFDLAVQAVLQAGPGFHLIAAGNNFSDVSNPALQQYSQKWKKFIAEKDIHHQIHMVGQQKDMSACYAACDVLIFPMRSMHQARPVFEAGLFGKPIIITDFECIEEFVQNGENGFAVEKNKVEEITHKLQLLYQNPQMAHEMGRNNYQRTMDNHAPDKNFQKLKDMIEDIIRL